MYILFHGMRDMKLYMLRTLTPEETEIYFLSTQKQFSILDWGRKSCPNPIIPLALLQQLPHHLLQNAAILVIADLLRSVDSHAGLEVEARTIGTLRPDWQQLPA